MNTNISLSNTLIKEIEKAFKKAKQPERYFDSNDKIDIATIIKTYEADTPGSYPMSDVYEQMNDDVVWEIENEHIKSILNDFRTEIAAENDIPEQDIDIDELADELYDEFIEFVKVKVDIRKIMPDIPVRLELISNYDCINSHWYEASCGGYEASNCYFADVMLKLAIDAKKMKALMIKHDCKVTGIWPGQSSRTPYVDLNKFWVEIENRSCGANLLTIIGKINSYDLLNTEDPILIIPAGNKVGFFSSFQGGGSVFETPLLRPMHIELDKKEDGGYRFWQLYIEGGDGYDIKQTFGVIDDFFDGDITIKKKKVKK